MIVFLWDNESIWKHLLIYISECLFCCSELFLVICDGKPWETRGYFSGRNMSEDTFVGGPPCHGLWLRKNRSCWCNSQKKNRFAWVKLRTLSLYVFRPSCFYESTLICFKVSLKSGSWPSFGVSWHWLLLSSDFASLASPHCWGLDIEYVEYVDIYANVTCPLGVVISNHVVRWWCWVS